MADGRYTIAVDLGESRVVAVAGYRNSSGDLEIAAVATRSTHGVRAGRIENIADVNGALSGAISELESTLGVEIQFAYGGISGEYVRTARHTETIIVEEPSNGICPADVVALSTLMGSVQPPVSDKIMESHPECYIIDGHNDIKNPVGRFGRTLSATYNFTLSDKEALKRLNLAFMQSGVSMKQCFANSIVASEAILTADEKEAGVVSVDLGKGVTNIAIYYHGTLRYIASIPIGGEALNHDLRSLMIHERNIEEKKCERGCAIAELAEKGSISVAGRTPRENRNIPLYNIAVAIESRISDIIIFVQREISDAGYAGRLPYGVVLSGGGANLRYVDELFRRNMDMEVRIANPEEGICVESIDKVAAPQYATVVGLLRRGVEMDGKSRGQSCTVINEVIEEVSPVEGDMEEQPVATSPQQEERRAVASAEEQSRNEPKEKERVTQTQLDLGEEDEEEDEDYEEDELEDEEETQSPKRQGSLSGFFKSIGDKMNTFFNNSHGDTEM